MTVRYLSPRTYENKLGKPNSWKWTTLSKFDKVTKSDCFLSSYPSEACHLVSGCEITLPKKSCHPLPSVILSLRVSLWYKSPWTIDLLNSSVNVAIRDCQFVDCRAAILSHKLHSALWAAEWDSPVKANDANEGIALGLWFYNSEKRKKWMKARSKLNLKLDSTSLLFDSPFNPLWQMKWILHHHFHKMVQVSVSSNRPRSEEVATSKSRRGQPVGTSCHLKQFCRC